MRFLYYLNEAVYKVNMSFIDNMFKDLEKELTKKMWFFKGRKLKLLNSKFKDINISFELNAYAPIDQKASSYKTKTDSGILGGTTYTDKKTIVIGVSKRFLKNLNNKKNWPWLKEILLDIIEHELIHIKQAYDKFIKPENMMYKALSKDDLEIYKEYLADEAEIMTYANTIAKEFKKFSKQFDLDPIAEFKEVWADINDYRNFKYDFPTLLFYYRFFPDTNSKVMKTLYNYVIEYLE